MSTPDDYVIITGGPGAGKSTLVDELQRRGFPGIPEAGRAILQDQIVIGGRARHEMDSLLFAEIMLSWDMRSHHEATRQAGTVFCDRGIPDVVGYFLLLGRPIPAHVTAAAEKFRYHRRVFLAPPWPAIYTHDRERSQNFGEAVRTHDAMAEAYTRHGYQLISLPRTDPESRAAFILQHLSPQPEN
ncbi:AAA family ATPase [Frankia sp. AiPs1]|uniref:AAA family ATPase n=1 Tax=Frankia sp. AiPs1 TaxID=573493 RepID=UPI0020430F5C|nr:AAA family ATPase [Frankia sp. AiPs1]MCM3921819.1 AAA family ATPase [Frankia sp. AiPs1]